MSSNEDAARFVKALRALAPQSEGLLDEARQNRQALAILRRGLGRAPGNDIAMYPYVLPAMPTGLDQDHQDIYFLVASLFALHPQPLKDTPYHNLGVSWWNLGQDPEEAKESFERRFVVLLSTSRQMLPEHLRHAISLLKANHIAVEWRQLLVDLLAWDDPRRRVQRQWAKDYWREKTSAEAPTAELSSEDEAQRDGSEAR